MYELIVFALAGVFSHLYIVLSRPPRGHRPVELALEIAPDFPIDGLRVNDEAADHRRGFRGRAPSGSRIEIETDCGTISIRAEAVVDGRPVRFGEWRA